MRDDALAAIAWLERFVSVSQWKNGKPLSKQWEHKDTHFVVDEAWIYEPWPDAERPFSFIRELYVQRRGYKAAKPYDVRKKFYKLLMNSLYGKTAQSVGGVLGEPEFREIIETTDAWDEETQGRKITERRIKFRVGEAKIIKSPPTANPYYAAATTAYCRRRIMEAACLDPHSIVFFATDGIVATNSIGGLPRVKAEGELLELGDWEYRKGHSGVFIHSGVYSYQKYEDGEWFALTKTRGLDPKRVTRERKINVVLVDQFLQAARRPYDSKLTIPIVIPSKHLVTIGMALAMAEHKRELWALAGRWSPEPGTPNALPRYINCDEPGKSASGLWGARPTGNRLKRARRAARATIPGLIEGAKRGLRREVYWIRLGA